MDKWTFLSMSFLGKKAGAEDKGDARNSMPVSSQEDQEDGGSPSSASGWHCPQEDVLVRLPDKTLLSGRHGASLPLVPPAQSVSSHSETDGKPFPPLPEAAISTLVNHAKPVPQEVSSFASWRISFGLSWVIILLIKNVSESFCERDLRVHVRFFLSCAGPSSIRFAVPTRSFVRSLCRKDSINSVRTKIEKDGERTVCQSF
mmetsp:Transcript_7959/g.15512  ORF Transcript_7959/g.15512 Transcript_7959/m.15512 type:complete len:202 (-) Transcript_7959:752-1357(-)